MTNKTVELLYKELEQLKILRAILTSDFNTEQISLAELYILWEAFSDSYSAQWLVIDKKLVADFVLWCDFKIADKDMITLEAAEDALDNILETHVYHFATYDEDGYCNDDDWEEYPVNKELVDTVWSFIEQQQAELEKLKESKDNTWWLIS